MFFRKIVCHITPLLHDFNYVATIEHEEGGFG